MSNPLICVAACAGAFGVKGEVKLKSFTAELEACLDYGPLRDEKGKVILTVTKSRMVKGALAVIAKEIKTREEAKALQSTKLYVYRADMPEPDEDEFYHEDLVGLWAIDEAGQKWGRIKAVQNFGAGDLLEIAGGTDAAGKKIRAFFHPFTLAAVPNVDTKSGHVTIVVEEPDVVPSGPDQGP